jgi:hypothetical protein
MKSRFSSTLAIMLIAAFLISTIAYIQPAHAQANDINLSPSINNFSSATVGTLFNVTVSITNSDPGGLGGAQVCLHFDDSILMVFAWAVPDGTNGAPLSPSFFMPLPDSALPGPPNPGYVHVAPGDGKVTVAVSKGANPPIAPWGHDGIICILEFNITASPAKLGALSCVLNINNADTFALDPTATPLPTTPHDGSYSNTWVAPPGPYMGLSPTSTTFGPNPPTAVGQTFTENIYVRSVSPLWYLTQALFDINYNSTIIDVLGGSLNITINPFWTGPNTIGYLPGDITIQVSGPASNPSGDVLVATLTFTVMMQEVAPPYPSAWADVSPLFFDNVFFYDHVGPVTHSTHADDTGTVTVNALRTLKQPWFEVRPYNVVMGPAPEIGNQFTVCVWLTGPPTAHLDQNWYAIGAQFRLFYDPTLIEPVAITEGSFFQDPQWDLHGTFFTGTHELDGLGEHVLVGNLLLPNGSGFYDQTVWPNGEGPVACITFEVLWQQCPNNASCTLGLTGVFGDWLLDKNGNFIAVDDPVNGTYTILPFNMPGRVLDIYGGADNRGYWPGYPAPFPAPYGGQGANHWMDIVFPQSEVTFYANLTYNYWPVQSKDIGFEIEGPFTKLPNGTLVPAPTFQIWAKLTATTGQDGVAVLTYRMPWPCDNPDGITGVWEVFATASVADVTLMDTTIFYYQRPVYITKVTTDSFYYTHGQDVCVTVAYSTHSVEMYPVLFSVTITDDLGVPFGFITYSTMVGGATFCTWKNSTFTVCITIPKWAYAGYGHVHVDAYDKDPTDGGFAWTPEFTPAPEIQIGPY